MPVKQMGQVISRYAQVNRLPGRSNFTAAASSDLLRAVTTSTNSGDYIRPVAYFDGYVWGVGNGSTVGLHRSSDSGDTWTQLNTNASFSHLVVALAPASDGELIVCQSVGVGKTSGFVANPATATVVSKTTANGLARYFGFSCDLQDPNRTKFIAAEYGPGPGQPWTDSRYAYISTDGGDTWTQVFDSLADTSPLLADSVQSHLHAACYDPWNDRFYLSEGHGTSAGVYMSDDDGATWTKLPGTGVEGAFTAACTVLIATEFGIVMGTDGGGNGLWVLPSLSDMTLGTPEQIGLWRPSIGAQGGFGFASGKYRDPNTGLVYVGFQSDVNLNVPLFSSDGQTAREIYSLALNNSGQRFYDILVTDDGTFLARGFVGASATDTKIKGVIKPFRSVKQAGAGDSSFVFNSPVNPLVQGSQVAIGPGSSLADAGSNCLAIGTDCSVGTGLIDAVCIGTRAPEAKTGSIVIATASGLKEAGTQAILIGSEVDAPGTRSIAIGYRADANSSSCVAIGAETVAAFGFSTVVGAKATDASNGSAVVIGWDAHSSASYDCIVGFSADGTGAGQSKTALGTAAQAAGTGAVALGAAANCAHADGVALGFQVETTAANQVCIEDRHIEFNEMTEPAAPAANGARLYVKDNGAGKSQLCVRFATGAVQVIATEP